MADEDASLVKFGNTLEGKEEALKVELEKEGGPSKMMDY